MKALHQPQSTKVVDPYGCIVFTAMFLSVLTVKLAFTSWNCIHLPICLHRLFCLH